MTSAIDIKGIKFTFPFQIANIDIASFQFKTQTFNAFLIVADREVFPWGLQNVQGLLISEKMLQFVNGDYRWSRRLRVWHFSQSWTFLFLSVGFSSQLQAHITFFRLSWFLFEWWKLSGGIYYVWWRIIYIVHILCSILVPLELRDSCG